MTNEELTDEVAALTSSLFAVGDLAKTLAAELKATNERLEFTLDSLQGTTYALEALIHAVMTGVVRNNELNQQMFLSVFNSRVEQLRTQMAPDALRNFDTTVDNARKWFDALAA